MILHELLSYEMLRLIWWFIMGFMLIAFAMTDGFDMGVGALLPFVAKTDLERRVVINTVGPVWEGNQVWLIAGGALIFAAWPTLYAISFSMFYFAMYLILVALIIRPVAFKFRSKREDPRWRQRWDMALCFSGVVPAFLFGVAVGNVLIGLPYHLTDSLHAVPDTGSLMRFVSLLHPFALLCGVTSLSLLILHGAGWLVLKTEGVIQHRARQYGNIAGPVALAGYALAGIWLAVGVTGYAFVTPPPHDGASNPLLYEVVREGSWLTAYATRPWILIAPVLGFLGAFMAWWSMRSGGSPLKWSMISIFGMISSVGLVMFPFMLPSRTAPTSSLAVWDSSSSHLSLFVMLVSAAIFLPTIMLYTAWVYRVLRGKVTPADIEDPGSHSY